MLIAVQNSDTNFLLSCLDLTDYFGELKRLCLLGALNNFMGMQGDTKQLRFPFDVKTVFKYILPGPVGIGNSLFLFLKQ